ILLRQLNEHGTLLSCVVKTELANIPADVANANRHRGQVSGFIGPREQSQIMRLCGHYDALLLYGSCARGDAGPNSDIDLLALDEACQPKPRLPSQFSLTVYSR